MKSRSFCVTQWNVDRGVEDYKKLMQEHSIQFIAYGDEICESTGRRHHQLFMYFINPKSTSGKNLGRIGSWFGDIHCHVSPMRGSFTQNEAYCKKDGSYTKLGEEPKQGARGDLNEVKDMLIKGETTVDEVCLEDPHMVHMYGRTLDRIEDIALRKKYRTEMTQGFWYYGKTGVGKSHKAFKGFSPDSCYVKNLNETWWDGYKGQKTVVLNEFRGQITFGELLDLCDKWPKSVSRRGREPVPFLAQKLIITSSKHPEDIYRNILGDGEHLDQLERRFQIIKMEQKCSEGNNGTSEPFFSRKL